MRALRLPRRLRGAEAPQPQGGTEGSDPPEHEDAAETPQPHVGMLASAPVPLDWERFADRRPRRLKRGKHFVGEPKILQREAEHAAKGMGKVALVSRDQQGKWGYVWVQFVDAEVKEDEPCPVCDSYELLKLTNDVIRCPSCDSMLEFRPRPLEMPALPRLNAPAVAPPDEVLPTDDVSTRASPRYDVSELAEIVSTRTLRADGTVAGAFSTDEALMMETTVRTHQPRLRIKVMINALVEDQRVFVSRQPEWSELARPGLYAINVHFPARFLTNHSYRLKVALKVDDGSGADPFTVIRRKRTGIDLRPEAGTSMLKQPFVRPALEWTTESVDTEDVDADFVSVEDDSRP